jgi:hypothetical protein
VDITKKKEEIVKAWQEFEREKARKHRGKHVGGPGKEDYRRGNTKGEVKHFKRRMTKTEVMKAKQKGVTEIVALGGFTEPAKQYAKSRNMKLFHRGRQA